jgi:hypothetical protein
MPVGDQDPARPVLRRSVAAYEAMVAHVLRLGAKGDDEETLKWVSFAATLAWLGHPGRYADARLEAVAVGIGQRLEAAQDFGPASDRPRANQRRRVLHVASTVYAVGGHTRLIESWIRNDDASEHSLVLVHQRQEQIRSELAGRIAASGGEIVVLPDEAPLLDKARRLRTVAQAGYDCIILHTHPYDAVPLTALATPHCPPVAVMNHADHAFWLGVAVADAVLDFRDFGSRLSRERRGARQSIVIPLPLDLAAGEDRMTARAQLGIPDAEVMMLSIGSAYKYTPTEKYDFFRTMNRVLAGNPAARLYLIGVGAADLARFGGVPHERMELLGTRSDPSLYEAAADLYLEGFPWGSYTALFETVARGVCPVLLYDPTPHTDISGDFGLKGLVTSPSDEADYVARVTALVEDKAARTTLGQAVAREVLATHGGAGSRAYLHDVYDRLAQAPHQFLPAAPAESLESEEDLNLARVSGAFIKTGLFNKIAYSALGGVTARDALRLLRLSIRAGDSRLSFAHAKGWLALLRHIAFSKRQASGASK